MGLLDFLTGGNKQQEAYPLDRMTLPIDAWGPERDRVVGRDELGRKIYQTQLGHRYFIEETTRDRPEGGYTRAAIRAIKQDPAGVAAGVVGGLLNTLNSPARALSGEAVTAGDAINLAGLLQLGGGAMPAPRGAIRSGALLSSDALPAASNEAEAMARQILDMRAAGRAGDVTDAMMARADPQYMFNNTPLPMDYASRMARAEGMGFDAPAYHGTAAEDPISAFDMSYAGSVSQQPAETAIFATKDPSIAGWFANYAHPDGEHINLGGAGQGQIMPITSRGTSAVTDFRGQEYNPDWMAARLAAARNTGKDRLNIVGMRETLDGFKPISEQTAIFDPTNIRSKYARFDPAFSHLANLSAANASPLVGLLAAINTQDPNRTGPR